MLLRGCFLAAKKVAVALDTLIRTQYPRDHLAVIGFAYYAREIRPGALAELTWHGYEYGTNLQHGLLLARRILERNPAVNKEIVVITDGEPTAHFEDGQVEFNYPPTRRTIQETLREVQRCTKEGITINTFMLERSRALAEFVAHMTRLNRGRAFYATPERLGEYVLVDFVEPAHEARVVAPIAVATASGATLSAAGGDEVDARGGDRGPVLPVRSCSCTSWARSWRSARRSRSRSWARWPAQGAAARELQRAPGRGHRATGSVYPLAIFQGITGVLLIIGAGGSSPRSQPWLVAGIILYLIALIYALTVQRNALHDLIELTVDARRRPATPPRTAAAPSSMADASRRSSAAGCSWRS